MDKGEARASSTLTDASQNAFDLGSSVPFFPFPPFSFIYIFYFVLRLLHHFQFLLSIPIPTSNGRNHHSSHHSHFFINPKWAKPSNGSAAFFVSKNHTHFSILLLILSSTSSNATLKITKKPTTMTPPPPPLPSSRSQPPDGRRLRRTLTLLPSKSRLHFVDFWFVPKLLLLGPTIKI